MLSVTLRIRTDALSSPSSGASRSTSSASISPSSGSSLFSYQSRRCSRTFASVAFSSHPTMIGFSPNPARISCSDHCAMSPIPASGGGMVSAFHSTPRGMMTVRCALSIPLTWSSHIRFSLRSSAWGRSSSWVDSTPSGTAEFWKNFFVNARAYRFTVMLSASGVIGDVPKNALTGSQ